MPPTRRAVEKFGNTQPALLALSKTAFSAVARVLGMGDVIPMDDVIPEDDGSKEGVPSGEVGKSFFLHACMRSTSYLPQHQVWLLLWS